MMKRILLIPALAGTLLLSACNTDQETTDKDKVDTPVTQEQTTNTTADEQNEATEQQVQEESEPAVTEQKKTKAEDAVKEVKIFKADENAENIVLSETTPYSFAEQGPVTKVILNQLNLMDYYKNHTVSGDEKTIMIDFKEELLATNLVQGSAGAWIFAGEIYASFFNTVPTLENIELRVNGKEVVMDHISFTGTVTREDFQLKYPGVTN